MFWSTNPPQSFPDYRHKGSEPTIKRQELNTSTLGIVGARNSGKSTFLAKSIIHKSDQENALILCTYPTERMFWSNIIQRYNITKTVVHTPDSLARYLISLWAKKEGKKIEWVLDKEVESNNLSKKTSGWRDEKGYALWLLKTNRMTAGTAHWLLSNEIENFIENKMLPNLDLFCVDEPEEWEPEAQKWVKLLPRTRTILATKSQETLWNDCEQLRLLGGTYDWQGVLSNYRYLKVSPSLPKELKRHSCIICQTEARSLRLKELSRISKSETRRAEQIKGRRYPQVYIESMPTCSESIIHWGTRLQTEQYLDLITSKGRTLGVIRQEDQESYLPTRKDGEKYLIWKPKIK